MILAGVVPTLLILGPIVTVGVVIAMWAPITAAVCRRRVQRDPMLRYEATSQALERAARPRRPE